MMSGFQKTPGRYAVWLVVAMLAFALPLSVSAQQTASDLRGQVTDQAGNPIANATVRILHVPSGTTRSTTTGGSGQFFQSGLRIGGPYDLQISAENFEGVTVEGVFLQPGTQPPIGVQMVSTAADLDRIRVVGARLVRAEELNLGVGSTFSSQDIQNQPSIDRDVISTLIRDPLAQSGGPNNLSVAGVNPRFNGLAIDGALQQDNFGLGSNTYATDRSPINIDVVESATLVASDYSLTASNFTGGLVNITTKSGTNEFDGNIYYAYRDDDFVGNDLGGGRSFNPAAFEEEEYGFFLSGPIIKDKLFFLVSYDEFDATEPVDFARFDDQDGIDPRIFPELNSIIQNSFGFDALGRPASASIPETSERLLAKLDWNINEDHRLSLTFQDNQETSTRGISNNNFESAFYDTPRDVTAYTAQMFSDWTSNFSTSFRFNLVEFDPNQICRAGPNIGELRIRLRPEQLVGTSLEGFLDDDTGQTTFTAGCDRFRHANEFSDERLQLFLSGDYVAGDHIITAGVEWENLETNNLFVERSRGRFTFNSLDDLINGNAQIGFRNLPSLNVEDGRALWEFDKLSLFIGDKWALTPDFELSYGLRYERFIQDDEPQFSQDIFDRFGVDTTANLDGNDLLMPRVGFLWTPLDRTTISGGFGLFAGGNPQVWISNAFQPPTTLEFGFFEGVNPTQIPQELLDTVAASQTTVIDVIDENFDTPSDWKASIRWEQRFNASIGNFDLGEDYRFTAQYLYSKTKDAFLWRNLAQTDLADALPTGVAPDGRPIFADLQDLGISNLIQLTNSDEGRSHIFSLGLAKAYDWGGNFDLSYAFQDVEAASEGTSSRGISSFRGISDINPNDPSSRTSPFEQRHAFNFSFGFERRLIADLVTRVDVFGQVLSGDLFTTTFDIDSDNALFGRPGDFESPFDNRPLYIPLPGNDPLVVFGSGFDQAGFFDFVARENLAIGEIVDPRGKRSKWNSLWDLRFQQELPGIPGLSRFVGENRFKVVFDIENLPNLLKNSWGTFKEGPSFGDAPIVRADLVSAADVAANGIDGATALTGDAPRLACQSQDDCLFRYNSFRNRDTSFVVPERSVYRLRLTLRYDF